MQRALKMIRDAEQEANLMQHEAQVQAERLIQKTEETLPEVARKSYEEIISDAKRRSRELVDKTKENAENEIKVFFLKTEKQIQDIQATARKNFDKAVDLVIKMITS